MRIEHFHVDRKVDKYQYNYVKIQTLFAYLTNVNTHLQPCIRRIDAYVNRFNFTGLRGYQAIVAISSTR